MKWETKLWITGHEEDAIIVETEGNAVIYVDDQARHLGFADYDSLLDHFDRPEECPYQVEIQRIS